MIFAIIHCSVEFNEIFEIFMKSNQILDIFIKFN